MSDESPQGGSGNGKKAPEPSFAEMFEASVPDRQLVPIGERVEGTVTSVGKEYVFLDLGTRTDGLLPVAEVTRDEEVTVKPGERITVLTTALRDGAVICSRRVGAGVSVDRGGDKEETLSALQDARDNDMPVEGMVKETVKGGYSVTVMGIRAFCPISQIQRGYTETPEEHVGRTYSFAIIELDPKGRNVVLSRRKLQDREAEVIAAERWETLEVGQVVTGTVESLKSYGAFVDIGGIQGLLHVSEISYERVGDPSEVLSQGDKVEVSIKELDRDKERISLSLKALVDDPWDVAADQLAEGQVLTGRVVRLAQFGAFVELVKGVEGLLHISEIGQGRRISTPREVLREGDQVTVQILSIDLERRRVSLAMGEEVDAEGAAEAAAAVRRARGSAKGGGKGLGTFADLLGGALKK